MTALDKAFIKVYTRDRHPRPIGLVRAPSVAERHSVSLPPIGVTLARLAGGYPNAEMLDTRAPVAPEQAAPAALALYAEEHATIDSQIDSQTGSLAEMPAAESHVDSHGSDEAMYRLDFQSGSEPSIHFPPVVDPPNDQPFVAIHEPLAGSMYATESQLVQPIGLPRTGEADSFRTSVSRPLSTFVGTASSAATFRPLLEVDRFAWPEVCGLLLGRVAADFDCFAEQLAMRTQEGQKVVAISGCHRGEGRTTILLCLAQRLAACGLRSVLFDADLARADLARRLGISAQVGWEDVLSGQSTLADVLIASVEDQLSLVPRRQKTKSDSATAANLGMSVMFDTLREAYDLVLLDCGPVAAEKELAELAALADAVHLDGIYLVCDARGNDSALVAESLQAAGLPVSGLIENYTAPTAATA